MGATSDLTKQVIEYLSYNHVVWRNNNVRAVRGRTFTGKMGVGDIIGYRKKDGKALFIEIKTGADKPSTEQLEFIADARNAGCIAFVAHSFDDMLKEIREY